MRPFQRAAMIAGFLCLVAFLLLASPGVRVVRAAGEGASEAPETSAEARCKAAAAELDDPVEAFRAHAGCERRSVATPMPTTIVLNTRGYNYDLTPALDPARANRGARGQRGN